MPTARNRRVPPPLKWHGGKYYLARDIVALMPRHLHYVEAFAGGLSVLLARDPGDPALWVDDNAGVSELVNDTNRELINFWRCLRSESDFAAMKRILEATPLARAAWEAAGVATDDPVECAVAFFVRCRQSLAGRRTGFTAITRNRTRAGVNADASAWWSAVEGLGAVRDRLKYVVVECLPALSVIRREDGPGTLFYLDPPYLHETRTTRIEYGDQEMSDRDHAELLDLVRQVRGKVMLSGYPSPLYDGALADWNRRELRVPNASSHAREKETKTEVVWMNY